MRLVEFLSRDAVSTGGLLKQSQSFAKMLKRHGSVAAQLGGPDRIYVNEDNSSEKLVVFFINGSDRAYGLSAGGLAGDSGDISQIYVWNVLFDINQLPDFTFQLPMNTKVKEYSDLLFKLLARPSEGVYEVGSQANMGVQEMATRTDATTFVRMAHNWCQEYDVETSRLSSDDLAEIADANDVLIPLAIRTDYKVQGTRFWDLSAMPEDPEIRQDYERGARAAGGEYDDAPEHDGEEPEIRSKLQALGKSASVFQNLNQRGRLVVLGRNAKTNRFFKIQGAEQAVRALENMLSRFQEMGLDDDSKPSLEEQTEELEMFTNAIATGTNQVYQSMIVTGGAGIGKTYTVMKVLKNLGLKEGQDYVVISGGITTTKLYERLFVSYNKLIVFDDCDSMWKDAEAANILKAALQTGMGARPITRDTARSGADTARMSAEDRREKLEQIRLFYDDPDLWAIKVLQSRFPEVSGLIELDPHENPFNNEGESKNDYNSWKKFYRENIQKPIETGSIPLPNKIEFEGRVIFISNLSNDQLDAAVRSRSMVLNIDVNDLQVVSFIKEKIVSNLEHKYLDDTDRNALIDYIEELYTVGLATAPFSIRMYQGMMDIKAMAKMNAGSDDTWKKMVKKRLT